MAVVRIPEEGRTLTESDAVAHYLASLGIDYDRWEPSHPVASDAPAEEILAAYAPEIEKLKAQGGYTMADVTYHPRGSGFFSMLRQRLRQREQRACTVCCARAICT